MKRSEKSVQERFREQRSGENGAAIDLKHDEVGEVLDIALDQLSRTAKFCRAAVQDLLAKL